MTRPERAWRFRQDEQEDWSILGAFCACFGLFLGFVAAAWLLGWGA